MGPPWSLLDLGQHCRLSDTFVSEVVPGRCETQDMTEVTEVTRNGENFVGSTNVPWKKPLFFWNGEFTPEKTKNAIWHFYKYIPGMRNHHFFEQIFVAESNVTATYAVNLNRNLRMLLNPHPFTATSQRRHVGTSSAGRRLSKDEASCDLPVDLNFLRRLLWIEIEGFNKNGRRYPSGG